MLKKKVYKEYATKSFKFSLSTCTKNTRYFIYTHTQARAHVQLASSVYYVRIVVKRAFLETDAIRVVTVSKKIPWTVIPLPGVAAASQNGEVC